MSSEEEAAQAYDRAAIQYRGKKVISGLYPQCLNFMRLVKLKWQNCSDGCESLISFLLPGCHQFWTQLLFPTGSPPCANFTLYFAAEAVAKSQ